MGKRFTAYVRAVRTAYRKIQRRGVILAFDLQVDEPNLSLSVVVDLPAEEPAIEIVDVGRLIDEGDDHE